MKHSYALLLPLIIGGCMSTTPEQKVSGSAGNAEPCAQSSVAAKAAGSERYPLVDLRSDLGESLLECERETVLKATKAVEEVIRLRRDKDKNNIGRGDHAKPLGCYKAEFTVSPPDVVRADERVGIAKPEHLGRTFRAIVRFSNSEPKNISDFGSATTGLAIKVMLDPADYSKDEYLLGRSGAQDFVAGGLRTFVSKDINDYADLFWLRIHPYSNVVHIKQRHPEAFTVFGTEPLLRWFNLSSGAAPIVLENEQFSSLVPYAWGDAAVKFRFERCHAFDRGTADFSRFDDGYQAKIVAEFLRSNDVCYVMKIQKRPRPSPAEQRNLIEKAFPIEDATAYWPETRGAENALGAEFREVARVQIKRGSMAMSDRACEDLAFNPWSGLKAHQPLGSLNRARLWVYKRSESVRKDIDRAMPEEQK